MSRRKSISSRFLRRSQRGSQQKATQRKRMPMRLEQFEQRLLMAGDGVGFVNTNPDADPGSVIGVAGVETKDDYFKMGANTAELRFDVLANDSLPTDSESFRIKSVSETLRGATVSISDDGQRIVYSPGEGKTYDTFYYIVEDSEGNLGKANVNVGAKSVPRILSGKDWFTVLEDGLEGNLNVLWNDGSFRNGEIIELEEFSDYGSSIRIADDGKSLVYQPAPGASRFEQYEYTVRDELGQTATFGVNISIIKPIEPRSDDYYFDGRPGPYVLGVLANDIVRPNTPEAPRIVEVSQPSIGGSLTISDDGQKVIFTPDENFLGKFSFTYTVRYGPQDYQTVDGYGTARVGNTFLAVDNWFAIDPGSSDNRLDVLANDPILAAGKKSVISPYNSRLSFGKVTLTIVEVSSADNGGQVSIENGQAIRYSPKAGFTGKETFTYIVEDSRGNRDSATVTLQVVDRLVEPTGVPKFILPGELEQFLIDQAVEQYSGQFGISYQSYIGRSYTRFVFLNASESDALTLDSSQTNTQESGVDEADIVETDGRYIYTFSRGNLVIADLADPANPLIVSITEFDDRYTEMYLQGDRITLIQRGSDRYGGYDVLIDGATVSSSRPYTPKKSPAVVTVFDVSDRTAPTIVERTEIDGQIVGSRAVGDQVYLTVSGLKLPELNSTVIGDVEAAQNYQFRVNETLDEYVARVRETLVETALPSYRTFAADGTQIASGLLTDPSLIHKPVDGQDNSLLSLVTFDVGDDQPGPLASTGIFTSLQSQVYMSGDSFYVMQNVMQRYNSETTIFKFSIADDGTPSLVATGTVGGNLLNQYSVDEYDGRFRIATTEVVYETYTDTFGNEQINRRQWQRFNNLFVLEQNGAALEIVGSVENLAPTETIKSVRFMDDVAYVVTFRVVDPLFVIDLSDPTNPTVEGSLKIPGFSSYLQPVGEDYVIGIGRDANEITGQLGSLQISLFYVGDMTNPTLVDQVTMEGAKWVYSEAWRDSLAVAYFPESQILTLPVSWYTEADTTSNGYRSWNQQSAIWTFQIDVDQQGGGSIASTGSVEHEGKARRSIRLGTSLVTISQDYIKVNNLFDVNEQLAELFLGPVAESGTNDQPGQGEVVPLDIAAIQSTQGFLISGWDGPGGSGHSSVSPMEISEVDQSLVSAPLENILIEAFLPITVIDSWQDVEISHFDQTFKGTQEHSRVEAAIDAVLGELDEAELNDIGLSV